MLDQPLKTHFAFARVHRVMKLSYLRTQEAHARRLVPTAALRPGMQQAACLFWSAFGSPNGEFVADYLAMKRQLGARERHGAALGLHMLIGISPGWIERMGDLHDPRNLRVQQLFQAVRAFCDRHLNGLFAVRMDLDERGGGVCDVFATHAHQRQARLRKNGSRGSPTTELSVKTALDEMSRLSGAQKSYAALQTLWAEYAREHLDTGIVRGVPKAVTGREHLSTELFRQAAERQRELEDQRRGLLQTISTTYSVCEEFGRRQLLREAEQEDRDADLTRRDLDQDTREAALAACVRDLNRREQQMGEREQAYTDWATEKYSYESSLTVRYSHVAIVQAEGEARLQQERAEIAAAQDRADAVAAVRVAQIDTRDAEVRTRERRLELREAGIERLQAEVLRKGTDLKASMAAADRSAADAEQRAAQADAASAHYATTTRQLGAGLSMMAKGVLDRDDLDNWPDIQEVRPLLEHAFAAVDARMRKERRALDLELQRAAARSRDLDGRDVELAARTHQLECEQAAVTDRSDAFNRGAAAIASGRVATPARIEADRTLAPAADLLTAMLVGVASATDAVRQRALRMQEEAERLSIAAGARMRLAEAAVADGRVRLRDIEAAANALAAEREIIDRHAAAWRVGVAEIETGRVTSPQAITGRPDLAPAAPDLVRAVLAIGSRVEQRTRHVAGQIAAVGEERALLATEIKNAHDAQSRALEVVREAEAHKRHASAIRADAESRALAADKMRASLARLLSSVSGLVTMAASRTDIPAALAPWLKSVSQAHKAYLDHGRSRR